MITKTNPVSMAEVEEIIGNIKDEENKEIRGYLKRF